MIDADEVDVDEEYLDKEISNQYRRVQREVSRLLVLAMARGYDGIDLLYNDDHPMHLVADNPFNAVGWHESPPHRTWPDEYFRYDFRTLTDEQVKKLKRRFGLNAITDTTPIGNNDS